MREVSQHPSAITAYLEVVVAGSGIGGLAPTCRIQRDSDSMYWNNAGAIWQVPPVDIPMAAGPYTGSYFYTIPPAFTTGPVNYPIGLPGYLIEIKELTGPRTEIVHVSPIRDLGEELLDNALSITEALKRMVSLRQDNVRVIYDTFTTDGKPTHGFVYVYDSKALLDGDTGPAYANAVGKYEYDATYDTSLRLEEYSSTRIS